MRHWKGFGIEYRMHQLPFPVFNGRQMDQVRQCIEVEDADAYIRCERRTIRSGRGESNATTLNTLVYQPRLSL